MNITEDLHLNLNNAWENDVEIISRFIFMVVFMFISGEYDVTSHRESTQVRSTVANMDTNANFDTGEV